MLYVFLWEAKVKISILHSLSGIRLKYKAESAAEQLIWH